MDDWSAQLVTARRDCAKTPLLLFGCDTAKASGVLPSLVLALNPGRTLPSRPVGSNVSRASQSDSGQDKPHQAQAKMSEQGQRIE
jgi:hypothetical protein